MKNLILIAAIGKNNELGKNNKLIWYLPEDLKFFKQKTINHTIVMGYNTFISLPKLLVDRTHIVLTHRNVEFPEGVIVCHNIVNLMNVLKLVNDDIYIIGGNSLYKEFIDKCNKMYLTEIDECDKKADVYFPKFNKDNWNKKVLSKNYFNDIKYEHVFYQKK